MARIFLLFLVASLGLASCQTYEPKLASDGRPAPKAYKIKSGDSAKIEYRMLDSINALRSAAGRTTLQLNAELNAAAATHSRDMSVQNRPWHFGSDGSSPIDRVRRAGYSGVMLGEVISETYESELETLSAWMAQPDTREIILDRNASDMGFAWYQESTGKIWWTLVIGGRSGQISVAEFAE